MRLRAKILLLSRLSHVPADDSSGLDSGSTFRIRGVKGSGGDEERSSACPNRWAARHLEVNDHTDSHFV